jgi:DNA-directed RNA polymerase specialized sigma subunit
LARDWAAARERASELQQREPVSVQPFGTITQYNKRPEWEGWAYAPLITQDIAHVRPTLSVPIERLRAAFPGWGVNESSDGLISIGAHPGAPVKEVVTLWFSENELHHDGVRDAKGVRRRNLRELQPAFLEDLVKKSVPFARGLINSRYAASMQRLVGDHDDIEGYTMMWIIELASSFDATLGRPFGTWLTNQIPRKVQDLNRASHGRTASDAEMKHAKGRAEFEGIHGRTPTNEELRNILGLSVEEMRTKRRHLAVLSGLRSSTPLDSGPDDPEIPIVDETANPEKDALAREQSEQITLALLAASGTFDPHLGRPIMTRPLGFLVTYLMTWDDWVKGDLIAMAGCADRKVTEEVELVTEHLAKSLQSLQNSR